MVEPLVLIPAELVLILAECKSMVELLVLMFAELVLIPVLADVEMV